jgi:hypothetical protein
VYAGSSTSGTLVTTMSGSLSSRTVTVYNAAAYVTFTTDSSVVYSNWAATYIISAS